MPSVERGDRALQVQFPPASDPSRVIGGAIQRQSVGVRAVQRLHSLQLGKRLCTHASRFEPLGKCRMRHRIVGIHLERPPELRDGFIVPAGEGEDHTRHEVHGHRQRICFETAADDGYRLFSPSAPRREKRRIGVVRRRVARVEPERGFERFLCRRPVPLVHHRDQTRRCVGFGEVGIQFESCIGRLPGDRHGLARRDAAEGVAEIEVRVGEP